MRLITGAILRISPTWQLRTGNFTQNLPKVVMESSHNACLREARLPMQWERLYLGLS